MKLRDLQKPIETLRGVGPAQARLFARLGVFTVADIISFYPKEYEDRTKRRALSSFREGKVHCAVEVTGHEWFGYGRMKTLKILVSDGETCAALAAFNRPFLEKAFPVGSVASLTGKFEERYGSLQSSSFELLKLCQSSSVLEWREAPLPDSAVIPIYPLTEGLSQKATRKAVAVALAEYAIGIEDEVPEKYIERRSLMRKRDALRAVHQPKSMAQAEEARRSIIYGELFDFQSAMAARAMERRGCLPSLEAVDESAKDAGDGEPTDEIEKKFRDNLSPLQSALLDRLPFRLTRDQMRSVMEMNQDIDRGYEERAKIEGGGADAGAKNVFTMRRLLQGDVGSGKTLVALFACLRAVNWKGQCAFMAPTELLARQHAESAARLLEPLGIRAAFLTGNVKSAGRNELLKQLKAGNIDIVVGTHALFSSQVVYNDLQLAVIDEQHRFGVLQRQAIVEKGRKSSRLSSDTLHLLMMSATPIPQTLALALFGDMDVSTIKTMPEGRKPVATYLVREGNERNAYEKTREELKAGRQAYFVYPAIDSENKKSAEEMFKFLSESVYPEFKCALLHSKIDEDEQAKTIDAFRAGSVQILAATTVIEVGVDVPNATCMVIEGADMFGLAALHQLRGRVGRGAAQSYCFLIYGKNISESGKARMKALRETTDGFRIAEEDLALRGPGEINGTLQAGDIRLGMSDLQRDKEILAEARLDAFEFQAERGRAKGAADGNVP